MLDWYHKLNDKKNVSIANFEEQGVPRAHQEYDQILKYVLHSIAQENKEEFASRLESICQQRAKRIPLGYLLGYAQVDDHYFYVDREVFIPRRQTGPFIKEVLSQIAPQVTCKVLDFCTGCGVIPIMLAARHPGVCALGVDLSAHAIEQAHINCHAHEGRLKGAVSFVQDDITKDVALMEYEQSVDVITANPPYVPKSDTLPVEWQLHQPKIALFADENGLSLVYACLKKAHLLLKENGLVFIEHGDDQHPMVATIMAQLGFESIELCVDQDNKPRFTQAKKSAKRGQ